MTKQGPFFTTWGSVRGCCGHAHATREAAEACLQDDRDGCAAQGGYSDREVRALASRGELQRYDVTRGPGEPLAIVGLRAIAPPAAELPGPRAYLRRLPCYDGDRARARVGQRLVLFASAEPVNVGLGSTADCAWWELPLPACPDCGGVLEWAEAGLVPGARRCEGCGSLYRVEVERGQA